MIVAWILVSGFVMAQTDWQWGFGKDGQPGEPAKYDHTLYVDDVVENGDGTQASPFNNIASAIGKASKLMKSMEMRRDTQIRELSPVLWLKLVRQGDRFTMQAAPDKNGAPGAWKDCGNGQTITMPKTFYAGLLICNGHGWPDKLAEAKVDKVRINGKPVAAWKHAQFARGRGTHRVDGDGISLSGYGERMKRNDWDDEGYFLSVQVTGDTEIVARVLSLTPSAKTNKGSIGLMMREIPRRNGKMSMIELFGEQKGGKIAYEVSEFYRKNRPSRGGSVRVIANAGRYYFANSIELPIRDDIADDFFFTIEGRGRVVFSGAEKPNRWKPATWTAVEDRVYKHKLSARGKIAKRSKDAIVALTSGAKGRVHLKPAKKWAKKPGTFAIQGGDLLMALPNGWTAGDFQQASLVEVTIRDVTAFYCNALAGMTPNRGPGNNVIFRNITIEHFGLPMAFNGYTGPRILNRNWLFKDVTFQHNVAGPKIRFIRDYTMDNVKCIKSREYGLGTITAQGRLVNCEIVDNGGNGWSMADKNVWAYNTVISRNSSHGIRMDHMAENLLFENCEVADNAGQGAIFETATGPVTFLNSVISNNLANTTWKGNDGQIGLATAHNFTFDGCTFTYSKHAAFSIYGRMRAHWPINSQYDKPGSLALPPNSMDYMQWGRLRGRDADPELLCQPNGEKPGSFNLGMIVRNCTFNTTGKDTLFYGEHHWDRDEAFDRLIRQELIAYNNEYHNPDNPTPFAIASEPGWNWGKEILGSWGQWQKNGNRKAMYWDPNYRFEAGSSFNGKALRNFTPAKRTLASSGNNKTGKVAGGYIRYEVEYLPFMADGEVELRSDPDASGGKYHKLLADQIGDYGQYVEYALNVPETGEYYVTIDYLRNFGPYEYLGYAQLTIDNQKKADRWLEDAWPNEVDTEYNPFNREHMYWDQSGLTKQFTSVPLGKVNLTAGSHRFRFDPAWKDGFISGDYDITIDAIRLSKSLNPLPAQQVADDSRGILYGFYDLTGTKGKGSGWFTRIPDLSPMKPELRGVIFNVGIMATKPEFGYRFEGFLDVPSTDIYTITAAVKGQANVYIDGKQLIDCNGPHGFYDKEAKESDAWYKYGRIALAEGKHKLRIDYCSFMGNPKFHLFWENSSFERQAIPESAFSYQAPK